MLGSLLSNIDLTDLFLECEDDKISSYADDTTPYSCAQDVISSSVISELQRITKNFFDWCRKNHMKANPEKCHVIYLKLKYTKGNSLSKCINFIKSK